MKLVTYTIKMLSEQRVYGFNKYVFFIPVLKIDQMF